MNGPCCREMIHAAAEDLRELDEESSLLANVEQLWRQACIQGVPLCKEIHKPRQNEFLRTLIFECSGRFHSLVQGSNCAPKPKDLLCSNTNSPAQDASEYLCKVLRTASSAKQDDGTNPSGSDLPGVDNTEPKAKRFKPAANEHGEVHMSMQSERYAASHGTNQTTRQNQDQQYCSAPTVKNLPGSDRVLQKDTHHDSGPPITEQDLRLSHDSDEELETPQPSQGIGVPTGGSHQPRGISVFHQNCVGERKASGSIETTELGVTNSVMSVLTLMKATERSLSCSMFLIK